MNRWPAVKLMLVLACTTVAAHAQTPPTVVEIAASLHVLVRFSDGSVVALGENRSGQLGRPKAIRRFFPAERVPLPAKAVQVAAGEDTSFALLDDGTVWAWGRGYTGTLGVDLKGATERHTPAAIPGLRGVVQIVASGDAAMALMTDGTVRAWGALPAFLTEGRQVHPGVPQPTPLPGLTNIARITGAPSMGFAVTRDGRVIGWGPQPPAELPTLKDVVSIATVAGAAIAVTRDGRAWTWGSNGQAGLGNGLHADTADPGQPTPQPVKGIIDAVEVKAGSYGRHVIVRRRNGTLIGWGNSDWGQLGAGITGDHQPTPRAIALPGVEAYWLGGNFSFARTKDQAVWFWGEQSAAQALLGVKGHQRVPAKVPMEKLRQAGDPTFSSWEPASKDSITVGGFPAASADFSATAGAGRRAPASRRGVFAAGIRYAPVFPRRGELRWDPRFSHTTREERTRALPGDELIADPIGSLTHSITIRRPPLRVWPWIAQMGAGTRAGWYSYDFIDNGRRRSAERLLPDLQEIAVGTLFPALPGESGGYRVLKFEAGRHLILGWRTAPNTAPTVTWTFVLEPVGDTDTRLITRVRGGRDYTFLRLPRAVSLGIVRIVHFIMQRKQLRGLARRAEREPVSQTPCGG